MARLPTAGLRRGGFESFPSREPESAETTGRRPGRSAATRSSIPIWRSRSDLPASGRPAGSCPRTRTRPRTGQPARIVVPPIRRCEGRRRAPPYRSLARFFCTSSSPPEQTMRLPRPLSVGGFPEWLCAAMCQTAASLSYPMRPERSVGGQREVVDRERGAHAVGRHELDAVVDRTDGGVRGNPAFLDDVIEERKQVDGP
jgi:hypothetical protein